MNHLFNTLISLFVISQSCKPYSIAPCEHYMEGELPTCGPYQKTPECKTVCDERVDIVYNEDLRTGSVYLIAMDDVEQIQIEILTNGPVEADYDVYEDFFSYSSGTCGLNASSFYIHGTLY